MKAMNFLKSVFVVACIFVANLTISANTPEANLQDERRHPYQLRKV